MKLKHLFLFSLLSSLPLQAASKKEISTLKTQLQLAENTHDKVRALLSLSKAYYRLGDSARALNQLERILHLPEKIKEDYLIEEVEAEYRKASRAFYNNTPIVVTTPPAQKENRGEFSTESTGQSNWLAKRFTNYKRTWTMGRPLLNRKLSPLSMGQLNGLNTIVGVPELESAYLLPLENRIAIDFKLDFGQYKENSTSVQQQLKVDSSITRALFEVSMPLSTLVKSKVNFPVDIKIGIPTIKWSQLPYFIASPNGSPLFNSNGGSFALGDIFIDAKFALQANETSAWAGKLRIKTPTGSTSDLAGSGSLDTAVSLLFSNNFTPRLGLNINGGVMFTGDAKNFNAGDVSMADIMFLGADLSYNIMGSHHIILNGDFHENAFGGYTNLSVLESSPTSIGFGYAAQMLSTRFFVGYKKGLNGATADHSLMLSIKQIR
jgi:hypothetical protein